MANIAEGSGRHTTSIETEMRLLDVAKASFDESLADSEDYLRVRNYVLMEPRETNNTPST